MHVNEFFEYSLINCRNKCQRHLVPAEVVKYKPENKARKYIMRCFCCDLNESFKNVYAYDECSNKDKTDEMIRDYFALAYGYDHKYEWERELDIKTIAKLKTSGIPIPYDIVRGK
jgi:hypothetical protein